MRRRASKRWLFGFSSHARPSETEPSCLHEHSAPSGASCRHCRGVSSASADRVVCENWIERLRSLTVVEPEETAQSLTTLQRACSGHRRLCRDELVTQATVWPFFVIMINEISDGRPEMLFAERHHAVQALGLHGLDKAFGKRVQIGTPRREDQRRNSTVPKETP